MVAADAAGLLLGVGLDAVFGDPRRGHPVAGYGRLAGALERRTYRPDRAAGVVHVGVAVGVPVAVAAAVGWATRRRPLWRTAAVAATTWAVLG
ncbi:MAG: cobalamin biosynthesis protein, partial [Micromonosporaceae bacterium]